MKINKKYSRQVLNKFLRKLFMVIEDPSTDELVHWSSEGDFFVITDRKKFITTILPDWFDLNKYSSFYR